MFSSFDKINFRKKDKMDKKNTLFWKRNTKEDRKSFTMEHISNINLEEIDKYMQILLKVEHGILEFPKIILRDPGAQDIFDKYAYRPDFVHKDDLILLQQINEKDFIDLRGHLRIIFWSSPLYMLIMAADKDFLITLKEGLKEELNIDKVNLSEAVSGLDLSNNEKTMVKEVLEYLMTKFDEDEIPSK